ncbi:MAG: hypothetical protein ACKO2P_19350, partial [Planctomycetota bacterium]
MTVASWNFAVQHARIPVLHAGADASAAQALSYTPQEITSMGTDASAALKALHSLLQQLARAEAGLSEGPRRIALAE